MPRTGDVHCSPESGGGSLVLAWWLFAVSYGPEAYEDFYAAAAAPIGLVVLFVFTWSLAFHLLNGIRHLAWDLGYGFAPATAQKTAVLVILFSLLLAAGAFALVWTGQAGYLK